MELAVFARALPDGRYSEKKKGAAVEIFGCSKPKKISGTARVTCDVTKRYGI